MYVFTSVYNNRSRQSIVLELLEQIKCRNKLPKRFQTSNRLLSALNINFCASATWSFLSSLSRFWKVICLSMLAGKTRTCYLKHARRCYACATQVKTLTALF